MKIAVVVQRYGPAINGGAELHARYIAEHLAKHAEVEVLTTCATDYVTWHNELPPGTEQINGITVRRFRVKRERDPEVFGRRSDRVFERQHSLRDELSWLEAEGPASPALVDHLEKHGDAYDYCVFFSYRYYHAFHGARAVAPRAILVPTAERDAAIGLTIFQSVFRGVRALMYNSPEERRMIQAVAHNSDVPGVVVGIGSDVPHDAQPARFRHKYNLRERFAVYVGRIDKNKGCPELFDFFKGYLRDPSGKLSLVLIGQSLLDVPQHPRIRHLGFVDDTDKFDAMAAADLLIMPSYYESLSMVALEAWALGRPVLVNGKCEVLKGQAIRSNAGLYYESYAEFLETLRSIEHNRWLSTALGRNGRSFFREHYDWPVIERKYLEMFQRLSKEPATRSMDSLPGWLDRRRQNLPAAEEVLAQLPAGAVLEERRDAPRPEPSPTPTPSRDESWSRPTGRPRQHHGHPRRGHGHSRRSSGSSR